VDNQKTDCPNCGSIKISIKNISDPSPFKEATCTTCGWRGDSETLLNNSELLG
jgi:transcription elongation factor Elf1